MERRLGVHPAILVPGVVMIGQFGILWLLLSAPIVAIAVDLVRYLHGRLSEPPTAGRRPAEERHAPGPPRAAAAGHAAGAAPPTTCDGAAAAPAAARRRRRRASDAATT